MAHKNRSNWSPYKARRKTATPNEAPAGSQKIPQGRSHPSTAHVNKDKMSDPTSTGARSQFGQSRHRRSKENYTFNEADDRLFDVFRNHGFGDYPHGKRQQLTRFYQLLLHNQGENNFTRLLTLRDVGIKHFIDSLMVTRLVDLPFPLLDMGTGPGFPGIPLKIHYPEGKIILAEGVQRRVDFLKYVRSELALKNLDIIGRNINAEFVYPVQGVITRAVEDARNTLGNVISCVQTGGHVYLMKGPNCEPEIQMALDAWGEYYSFEKNIAYQLPDTPHERRLLVFKKIKTKNIPEPDWDDEDP